MKNCKKCKKQFNIDESDRAFYNKVKTPEPTHCPECRQQRRFAFRNERALYAGKCDLCKKNLISFYSSKFSGKVFCQDCWRSDKWDAHKYAREYDSSRPFSEQLNELFFEVPQVAAVNTGSENSTFTAHSLYNKNSYMLVSALNNEDCYYGIQILESRDVVDSAFARESELCYELIDCEKMYNSKFCIKSTNCNDSLFLYDSHGCNKCFMSSNLRNKSYCFKNKQYTKEEYEKKIAKYNLGNFKTAEELKDEFKKMMQDDAIHKYTNQIKCEDSTGDHLLNCTNCLECYDVRNAEDCKFIIVAPGGSKDSYDTNYTPAGEWMYEVLSGSEGHSQQFSQYCWGTARAQYCSYVMNSEDCFGCVGLQKAQYCILNKKYSKEEYKKLRARIIEDMSVKDEPLPNDGQAFLGGRECGKYGEFLPAALSPFGYNETIANDFWPLKKQEALAQGFNWNDAAQGTYEKETKKWDEIADDIASVDKAICNEMLVCTKCTRNYKITKQEFSFYKKHGVALPRACFDCRHMERMNSRNPRKLWERECTYEGCANKFETSYAPERKEKVFCEECYLKETL